MNLPVTLFSEINNAVKPTTVGMAHYLIQLKCACQWHSDFERVSFPAGVIAAGVIYRKGSVLQLTEVNA